MKNDLLSLLGSNLRRLRLKAGLKIVQLSEDIDYPASHISNVEYGKVNASLDFLAAVIDRIKCHPFELFIEQNQHVVDDTDYKLLEYARLRLLNHTSEPPRPPIPSYKSEIQQSMIHEPKARHLKKSTKKPKK